MTPSDTAAPDALLYKLASKFLRQGYLLTYWLPLAADTVSLSGCVTGPIAGYLWSDSLCSVKTLLYFNQKNKHTAAKTNRPTTVNASYTVFMTDLSSV